MNRSRLLDLARQYFILDDGLSEANLIRKIQLAEGHFDCFATTRARTCDVRDCQWREACMREAADPDIAEQ